MFEQTRCENKQTNKVMYGKQIPESIIKKMQLQSEGRKK